MSIRSTFLRKGRTSYFTSEDWRLEVFHEFSQKQTAFLGQAVKEYGFVHSYHGQQYRYLDFSYDRLDRFFDLYRYHSDYIHVKHMEEKI